MQASFDAGKDVIADKPIANTLVEADEMLAAARCWPRPSVRRAEFQAAEATRLLEMAEEAVRAPTKEFRTIAERDP